MVVKEYNVDYKARLKEAEERKIYFCYGRDIDKMTDEEAKQAYSNMQNYLSDARTHDV